MRIYLASTEKGAARVGLSLSPAIGCVNYFRPIFPEHEVKEDDGATRALGKAVSGVLNNKPASEKLSLDIQATPFQIKVWRTISRIPFGTFKTYGEVAVMAGRPGAARAIGQAMARNPLPLIFP